MITVKVQIERRYYGIYEIKTFRVNRLEDLQKYLIEDEKALSYKILESGRAV